MKLVEDFEAAAPRFSWKCPKRFLAKTVHF